jgi:alpha-tubulin suppressor-like RCC1 family protein
MVGSIDVTVVTTGQGLDPDGYLVHLDGDSGTEITANGSLSFPDLSVGNHTMELSEVADNCTVLSSNPQTVSVPLSDAAQATFEVECISIAFGSVHALAGFSCGLEEGTGKAYCWGANADGELGTGTVSHSLTTPHAVQTEATFDRLPTGYTNHSFMCGITRAGAAASAGEVWCWGHGFDLTPAPLDLPGGVNGIGSLTVFGGPGLAGLSLAGQVYVWALDEAILGDAGPAPPDGSPDWASVSYNAYLSCGITTAGNAYCWAGMASICQSGSFNCNRFGQFGNGTTDHSLTPVEVTDPPEGPVSWQMVEVGNEFSCGLTDAGRLYCWGSNYMGMLGSGDETEDFYYSTVPVEAAGARTYTALSVGLEHVCAIETGGAVYCWGSNKEGQLGVADTGYPGCSRGNPWLTPCSNVPLAVETSLLFTSIDAGLGSGAGGESAWGSGHNCGIAADGVAYCWGANHSGELGDGSFTGSSSPVRVSHQANP